MAIAYSSSASSQNSGSTSLTYALNNASGNFLLVGVADNTATSTNVTGVTYGGVAMTLITSILKSASNPFYIHLYYLARPLLGSNNVVVSRTSGSGDLYSIASSYSGVFYNVIDAYNTTTRDGAGSTFTETITSILDNCWAASIVFNDYGGLSANTGSERQVLSGAVGFYDTNTPKTPAGSISLVQNNTSNAANKSRAITATFAPDIITVNNSGTATATGTTSVTLSSFTISGSNPCLIVSVCDQNNGGSVTGVTANGVAMTQIDSQSISGSNGVSLWGLYGATTGNIVATRTGTSDRITICAVNYANVSTSTALTSLVKVKGTATGTTIAATLTPKVANAWVTMGTYVSAGGDPTTAGAQTYKRVAEPEIGDHWDSNGSIGPSAAFTLNVNNGGSYAYAYIAVALEPYLANSVDYLIVAGGGGGAGGDTGGGPAGGGGGAGGFLQGTDTLAVGTYAVVVGGGGAGGGSNASGVAGSNSSFNSHTANGGGNGGRRANGGNGGSGGGGGDGPSTGGVGSQGKNGGGQATGTSTAGAGGGGGATVVGGSTSGSGVPGGDGGAGLTTSITGSSASFAGGGGGGGGSATNGGAAGAGGGGKGGDGTAAGAGTANTGGGGGGGRAAGGQVGAAGGSGIVIIRLRTADWGSITGGTQSTDGAYTVCQFTANGNLVLANASASNSNMLMHM